MRELEYKVDFVTNKANRQIRNVTRILLLGNTNFGQPVLPYVLGAAKLSNSQYQGIMQDESEVMKRSDMRCRVLT